MFNPLKAVFNLFRGVPDDLLQEYLRPQDGFRVGAGSTLSRAERRRKTRRRKEAHRLRMRAKGLKGGKRRV